MADPGHFWIGLRLVADKATKTSSSDFRDNGINLGFNQFSCQRAEPIRIPFSEFALNGDIQPFSVTKFAQRRYECIEGFKTCIGTICAARCEKTYPRYLRYLLRPRR